LQRRLSQQVEKIVEGRSLNFDARKILLSCFIILLKCSYLTSNPGLLSGNKSKRLIKIKQIALFRVLLWLSQGIIATLFR